MSAITIAANDSLSIIKEGDEIFVISKDKQFRNSYQNVVNSGKLFGVGYHVDGKAADITRWLTQAEMDYLLLNGLNQLIINYILRVSKFH